MPENQESMVVCWCNLQIKVIVGIIGLLFMGKLLEPMREFMREFLKFIFIVKFPTPVCIFITTILLYYIQDMKTTCNSWVYAVRMMRIVILTMAIVKMTLTMMIATTMSMERFHSRICCLYVTLGLEYDISTMLEK